MSLSPILPVGVVLAGGLSRRMFEGNTLDGITGVRDKGLLPLGHISMIEVVLGIIKPQTLAQVINANGDGSRFASLGLPVVPDTISGFVGPLAGVLAGMRWAATTHPAASHILTVSSDAPFLPANLVARLSSAIVGKSASAIAIAASNAELHPVIGLWPVALADDLERALASGVRKVLRWTDTHGTVPVEFPFRQAGVERVDPFFNANTQAELDEARRLLPYLAQS